ncbi:MAG: undecaprenyl/decaprenyl-phosphate alpha-N-acetylglucosaminyl 1-phosphate transferase [Clostridiales bacterium]|jgi:UDP-GlcNAc:undecaprenyl-phosphate GlcNAc-1-phosphate transferase|nr:undecaprenyl/decaprenyl-phosphate alpha-N-acetylglucosaminyl 1-phosphate transferase [Clostridiales bacterium]
MIALDNIRLIFTFIVAFLLAFATTPIVKIFAERIGAMDIPKDSRRVHNHPIPRLGGLAIFYSFLIAILCFCDITIPIRGILLGAVIIVTVGVIDDLTNLPAWSKLLFQIIAASVVILHGVTIEFFTNPFNTESYINLGFWSIPITLIWIIGITNAVNLIDGLDGLAVGVSSITAISLLVISIIMNESGIAILSIALAGSGFGFIPFNFYPAKIFMGDTGSMFLGYMLACISLLGLFKVYALLSFAVPFLILALPIFDTVFAIFRRLAKGQSPMTPDRGHMHHRLIDRGFTQKQAVTILYTLSSLLSLSAVVLMLNGGGRAIILIISVFALIVAGGIYFKETKEINRSE